MKRHHRRKLPDDGAEFFPEAKEPGGEKVGEGLPRFRQLAEVRQEAPALEREHKAGRSDLVPRLEGRRPLQGVEGSVDFERVETPAGVGQLVLLRQSDRVEIPPPRRVVPTRDADADFGETT